MAVVRELNVRHAGHRASTVSYCPRQPTVGSGQSTALHSERCVPHERPDPQSHEERGDRSRRHAHTTATLAAAPAQAQPPNQGTWDNPPADFVDPDVCAYLGIVVTGAERDSARWPVNFNADGSFKVGFVHHQLHVVAHANGKTMYEDDA
jgi:hypothetical protein